MITNAKVYVAELEADSPTLQDINEQFRLVCKPLRLVSFYETLKTQVGTSRALVNTHSPLPLFPIVSDVQ